MIIELLFIASIGYVILWCGTHGDPRAGLRQLLRWRPPLPGRTRPPVVEEAPPVVATASDPAGTPTSTSPTIEQVDATDALTEARWNALIAELDDLDGLDLDPD
jgi:hypothetical protein